MATLGVFGAIGAWAMTGKQKAKQDGPPINATSKDEEKFIQYVHALGPHVIASGVVAEIDGKCNREFIDKANKEGQPAKH